MRSLCFIAFVWMVSFQVLAQGSSFQWKETAFHFGNILEKDGDARHRFWIKNQGPNPLTILRADATCGCTTPAIRRDAIAKGDSGYVDVVYHAQGRPGSFTKHVTVETDGQPAHSDLTISGMVIKQELTLKDLYPDTLGHGLRTSSRYLNLGIASPLEGKTEGEFEVLNTGTEAVRLKAAKVPAWMKVKVEPAVLEPGMKGRLRLSYEGKARKDFGYLSDAFELQTSGQGRPVTTRLYASINLTLQPQELSEEAAAKRGRLEVDKPAAYLGKVPNNRVYTHTFDLRNAGPAPLEIYGVKATCACLKYELLGKRIGGGKATKVVAHLDANGMAAEEEVTLAIYSSDPLKPVTTLRIKGDFLGPNMQILAPNK